MLFRIEAKDPKIINIFIAPLRDLEPLKEQVRYSNSIKMLMHAYFPGDPEKEGWYRSLPGYEEERDAIVQASPEEPVIIGEEAQSAKNLPLRIERRLISPPEQLYICTTEYNRASPQKPGLLHGLHRKVSSWFNQNQSQEAWDRLARIFAWLGVENVALGGQHLTYIDVNTSRENSETGLLLKGALEKLAQPGIGRLDIPDATGASKLLPSTCVGGTALNLALRGFNVSLSLPSSPKKIIRLS
ncbi:hypothetical protein A2867_01550 [Candidatus Daviesbacteria bacterium RIFCSPHIGHO2_01_FULL_40_11]|uniref:Uncharacterized protein n=1 Tax=Candidatus Daviesbacteria bacterium RIFCSPHIGHO2_01_FULL_40_11 TaxID=1797762 RepID=A0A1F5JHH4_9BACT|nr:MAG: hypothetical protein A2867_01550 [Candidatus Daviesbacteria bacterium RIFCSPHIGHO2_01_FULL_40_11]OGE62625.1 MAG: hypothetical protein A2964_02545 [Candidatus Daviesbacteria bacterium RIFCSPLOWO2_01_FULL_40_27]